jgi:hypothetical protein
MTTNTAAKKSLATRTLDYLKKHENQGVSVKEISAALKADNRTVSTTIANNMRRAGRDSDWRKVQRTDRGHYGYQPDASPALDLTSSPAPKRTRAKTAQSAKQTSGSWEEVGRDADTYGRDVVIVRDPSGKVYVARRLGSYA